jgi:fumarate hydratase subunit alpha
MSALAMLTPAQGLKGVKAFVLDTVVRGGGTALPADHRGVGSAAPPTRPPMLAKEALLRPLDVPNGDPDLECPGARAEGSAQRHRRRAHGLGGRTTVLGVRCGMAFCHTASLPVAVNLQCRARPEASMRVHPDGRTERLP